MSNFIESEPTEKELSIYDMLQTAKVYFWELLRFWWLILIPALALGYYFRSQKKKEPTLYTATLTFMLSEDKAFQQNLLSSMGLGLGLGGGDNVSLSLSKLEELLTTRKIIQLALFKKRVLHDADGKPYEDYLINHFLNIYSRPIWKESNSPLANFYFKSDSVPTFTRDENSLLLSIHSQIRGQLSKFASAGGIFTMSLSSITEEFSYEFIITLFEELNLYYTESSSEKQRLLHEAAQKRMDNLYGEMKEAEDDYIDFLNTNNSESKGRHDIGIKRQFLARKLQVGMESYFAAVRNEEAAEVSLEQQTPIIQLIDPPLYPLQVLRPSSFFHTILGLFLGGFMGIVIVLGRKLISDWWAKEKARNQSQTTTTPTSTN